MVGGMTDAAIRFSLSSGLGAKYGCTSVLAAARGVADAGCVVTPL